MAKVEEATVGGGWFSDDRTEAARTEILDAVIRCFATQGWAGTNMSLVARETGMTRGRIQYYYPVLEDLKFAAIGRLGAAWRTRYFSLLRQIANSREKFDKGVDLLWEHTRDPLFLARQALEASARTDPALDKALNRLDAVDEDQNVAATLKSFPDMAAAGRDELILARYYTMVFIEGLSCRRFPKDTEMWRARLIDMLKQSLIDFWAHRGVDALNGATPTPLAVRAEATLVSPADDRKRKKALSLMMEAMDLLSGDDDRKA